MIVFLNGPFGVGKTTTARLLVERLPDARIFNPERVGIVVRAVVRPLNPAADYQDTHAWRLLVPLVARLLAVETGGPLIMPMTVWRRDYFDEMVVRLRRVDRDLRCIQLTASANILQQRIFARLDAEGGHAWCFAHLEAGLAMAKDPAFGVRVTTDGRSPAEVAEAVRRLLRVELRRFDRHRTGRPT